MTTIAPIQTIKMTAEQYMQLGEDPPGVRLELIDGQIVVSPSAYPRHSRVIARLTQILLAHIEQNKLGELFLDTDIPFEEHIVRRPDVCFYATANLHLVTPTRLSPSPDLCIEVLSPNNIDDDRFNKFDLYRRHGVPHYWIVDPENRTAECFSLVSGNYQLTASGRHTDVVKFSPFNELSIPLDQLWMPGS